MAMARTQAVLGLFNSPDEAADALDTLRAAGFLDSEMTVLTDAPYPEGAFGEAPERHRLYVWPFIGAACGLAVGLVLTVGTQLSYPVVTGGKPLLAIPPMINVLYEGTMLGALIMTVIGIIFESRLPDLSAAPYDPRISQGYFGVLVFRLAGREDLAERALRESGAIDIVGSLPHG